MFIDWLILSLGLSVGGVLDCERLGVATMKEADKTKKIRWKVRMEAMRDTRILLIEGMNRIHAGGNRGDDDGSHGRTVSLFKAGGIRFEEWSRGAESAAEGWNGHRTELAAALFRN
jgi:hypothetical protein